MLLRHGAWVAVAGTATVLLWREGTLVVGGMTSITVLAVYVVATRFFDAGVTVAHTAGFGLLPGLSALAGDPAAFRAAVRRYTGLTALAGVGVAVVGGLLAEPITTLLFGDEWRVAVPAVRWAAVAAVPVLLTHVLFSVLLARGQARWLALSAATGSTLGTTATVLAVHAHPTAAAGVFGTALGAAVVAVLLLVGIRDLLLPGHGDTTTALGPVAS
jgi:O-antigen/teichoic acid export membrane protein